MVGAQEFFVGGGGIYPIHCGVSNSIPGLCPPDASQQQLSLPSCDNQKSLWALLMYLFS